MRQGAARHSVRTSGALYETPEAATLALLRVEDLGDFVWEPAAGKGAIARLLIPVVPVVYCSDLNDYGVTDPEIETGVDFLLCHERLPPGGGTICTNPPYSLADDFIRHGLGLGFRVIVFLRLMFIEGKGRSDLIDGHCRRIWAGIERLPMIHREGWDGPKLTSGGMPFGWFVFEPEPRPADQPIELRRISWRAS